jgi:RNA-binding protein YlmH
MNSIIHAKNSIKRYGGIIDDYMKIHEFVDSSKSCLADVRHRAILHNTLGPYLAARVFGDYITNSDNKQVTVRQIVEDHIIEDLGKIPTIEDWLSNVQVETWMLGMRDSTVKKIIANLNIEDE